MIKKYNIFDFFLDGIFVIDENKNIVYCNQVAANLFGLRVKRLLNKPAYDHFIFNDSSLFCMQEGEIGKDSASKYVEVDFTSSKGAEGSVQVMIQPDKANQDGSFWIVYFHDVTDEKKNLFKIQIGIPGKRKGPKPHLQDPGRSEGIRKHGLDRRHDRSAQLQIFSKQYRRGIE